jgi:hypothetical protein
VIDYYTKLNIKKIKEKKELSEKLHDEIFKLKCPDCYLGNKKKVILACKKHAKCGNCYKKNNTCNKCK